VERDAKEEIYTEVDARDEQEASEAGLRNAKADLTNWRHVTDSPFTHVVEVTEVS
jgi:hypothetical protein